MQVEDQKDQKMNIIISIHDIHYIQGGKKTPDFVTSVMECDGKGTTGQADDENCKVLSKHSSVPAKCKNHLLIYIWTATA